MRLATKSDNHCAREIVTVVRYVLAQHETSISEPLADDLLDAVEALLSGRRPRPNGIEGGFQPADTVRIVESDGALSVRMHVVTVRRHPWGDELVLAGDYERRTVHAARCVHETCASSSLTAAVSLHD